MEIFDRKIYCWTTKYQEILKKKKEGDGAAPTQRHLMMGFDYIRMTKNKKNVLTRKNLLHHSSSMLKQRTEEEQPSSTRMSNPAQIHAHTHALTFFFVLLSLLLANAVHSLSSSLTNTSERQTSLSFSHPIPFKLPLCRDVSTEI